MPTTSTAAELPLALHRTLIVLVSQTLYFPGCHVGDIYKHNFPLLGAETATEYATDQQHGRPSLYGVGNGQHREQGVQGPDTRQRTNNEHNHY
jgi:hypothetical protein